MGRRKWNIEKCRDVFSKKGYILIEKEYFNNRKKMLVEHSLCGNIFSIDLHNFLAGKECPKCSLKKSAKSRNRTLIKKNGHFIDSKNEWSPKNANPPSEYTPQSNKKVLWICDIHGEYIMTVASKTSDSLCPQCAFESRKIQKRKTIIFRNGSLVETNRDLIDEWSELNSETPEECTFGSAKKIWWICKNGHPDFLMSINKRTTRNMGCPKCSASVGEKIICSILEKNNVEFFRQYRFSDCKYKYTLSFDFYIPKLNLCIEYQGEHHYEPIRFGGISEDVAKKNFIEQKKRDKAKRDFCKTKKINLLAIKYTKIDKIYKIIYGIVEGINK